MGSSSEKADNTKVASDIATINNALEAYSQENATLPMPG
jgi:type II secretory pathway pseudopilin PulG